MANTFYTKILSKAIPIVGNKQTIGGETYTDYSIDKNVNRAFGGAYDFGGAIDGYGGISYTENNIAYWENAVITAKSYDGLNDSGWTELADVTDGTIPTSINVLAVEFIKDITTSSPNAVRIALEASGGTGSTYQVILAALFKGDAVVIPIFGGDGAAGISASKVLIKASKYTNGTDEATVNVMIAGK